MTYSSPLGRGQPSVSEAGEGIFNPELEFTRPSSPFAALGYFSRREKNVWLLPRHRIGFRYASACPLPNGVEKPAKGKPRGSFDLGLHPLGDPCFWSDTIPVKGRTASSRRFVDGREDIHRPARMLPSRSPMQTVVPSSCGGCRSSRCRYRSHIQVRELAARAVTRQPSRSQAETLHPRKPSRRRLRRRFAHLMWCLPPQR